MNPKLIKWKKNGYNHTIMSRIRKDAHTRMDNAIISFILLYKHFVKGKMSNPYKFDVTLKGYKYTITLCKNTGDKNIETEEEKEA